MRTNKKHLRLYVDGYDMSGYIRDAGACGFTFDSVPDATVTDLVKNSINGYANINAGPFNAVLDNDASTYPAGMFSKFQVSGTPHNVVVPFGTQAAPIAGDPMFAWYLNQTNYSVTGGDGFVTVNLAMDQAGTMVGYVKPFGYLNHAYGAETGANSANNTLFMDAVGQTALGGYFVYQLITASGGAGAGTVTLSLDDSANSTAWTALSGATSGALVTANTSAATIPRSGMIKLSSTAVVRQYLRWQLALSVQTTATFVCGFIRNT